MPGMAWRRNSRETVDGARLTRRPISRTPKPVPARSAISIRSSWEEPGADLAHLKAVQRRQEPDRLTSAVRLVAVCPVPPSGP